MPKLTDSQNFKKLPSEEKAAILEKKAARKAAKIERRELVKSAKKEVAEGLPKTSQEIITLCSDMLDTVLTFQDKVCTVSTFAEQPATCEKEAISKARQEAPAKFVKCLIDMFPQLAELNKLILCVILKLLFGRIKFVKPRCNTAINVRRHLHVQDLKQRNVDGSIAARAKICADNTKCLDCTGIQAWNVLRHHHGCMYNCAIKKMLISLLNGHETALEAFWKFLKIEYNYKIDVVPYIVGTYSSLIDMFIPQFHRMEHFDDFQRFSDKERGEIANMILEQCGMTIEEVESRITAFLSKPPE